MRQRARKRTILLAVTSTHHVFCRGAARYAAEHYWHVVADIIYDATIPIGWRGDGILSFVVHWENLAKYVVSAGVPVVEISSVRKDLEIPCVMEDNEAIGRLGAEHLLERNFKNFAWAAAQFFTVRAAQKDPIENSETFFQKLCAMGNKIDYI
jgi:LacI family transcriptional regulator